MTKPQSPRNSSRKSRSKTTLTASDARLEKKVRRMVSEVFDLEGWWELTPFQRTIAGFFLWGHTEPTRGNSLINVQKKRVGKITVEFYEKPIATEGRVAL